MPVIPRTADPDTLLDAFLSRVSDMGLELYPAQEEAILELMAGRNVILNTPTGSGKSMVALAMHWKALAEGRRSYYTSPIKALVSEKFFDLCRELGPENVGMLTGDASINARAPIVCCTAEVLANVALREWEQARIDYVTMDEFHYYADPDRGMAWQIPLLVLPQATFLLMSATLGDVSEFERGIAERTGRKVAVVRSDQRPVPLDFQYGESPLHETIAGLVEHDKAPIYLVNFTQREAAEQAQNLTSVNLCSKERRDAIRESVGDFRFDSPYGKDMKRFVHHGIGLHHAGLLPKYRLLVEKLSQQGLLVVISGTDTLGVGVNVPIRTVLFTKLCKFDGARVALLSVRDFKQIAGRAGRKGFDVRGTVVVQAPEHVIENKRMESKAGADPKKRKKMVRKKPPEKGFVPWDEATFRRMVESAPEPLESRFEVGHGTLVGVMEREFAHGRRDGGYRRVVELIARSYERAPQKARHRRRAAQLFRSLRASGVLEVAEVPWARSPAVRISPDLQRDFSLHHTLSLWLVDALFALDPAGESYAMDVISMVEAILDSPQPVLLRQIDRIKAELIEQLKADGVDYDQRIERLQEVTHPQPNGEFIERTFEIFREAHPWVRSALVRPKSIARDLFERYLTFNQYVGEYELHRSEGLLLRYLSEAYKTLVQSVPDHYKTQDVHDAIAFLRAVVTRVDSSLVQEWEAMVHGDRETAEDHHPPRTLADDPEAFAARVRAEIHRLVKALADEDFDEAACAVRGDAAESWTPDRIEKALIPFRSEHGRVRFDHAARFPKLTHVKKVADKRWTVRQTLVAADGETEWMVEGEIDLDLEVTPDEPLLSLVRITI